VIRLEEEGFSPFSGSKLELAASPFLAFSSPLSLWFFSFVASCLVLVD
jgi:hypothetical protein